MAGLPAVINTMQPPTPVLATEDRMGLWDMATATAAATVQSTSGGASR
ncbi:MAG: hypothetical protein ACJ72M_06735 [Propionibacteriaceae bacterium]